MGYFLSPSLVKLRSQVNDLWPGRDKASDGWIGDAAHSSRVSDHNPDGDGSVNAFDFDNDGINVEALISAAVRDRRTNYVISRGIIRRRAAGWRAEVYTGANPHNHHVHISIMHGDTYEDDLTPWALTSTVSDPSGGGGYVPSIPGVTPPTPIAPQEDIVATRAELQADIAAALVPVMQAINATGKALAFRIENTDAAYLHCGGVRVNLTAAQNAGFAAEIRAIPASDSFWTLPLMGKNGQAFQRETPLPGEEPGSLYYVEDGQAVHVTPERYALDLKPPIKVVPNTAGLWSLPTKAAA